jgi:hypothetical protein
LGQLSESNSALLESILLRESSLFFFASLASITVTKG